MRSGGIYLFEIDDWSISNRWMKPMGAIFMKMAVLLKENALRVNFFDLHKEARWDRILSTQRFLRGRDRILSTQRFSGGRDRILSTQSGVPGSASTRSGVTRRHWGVRSDRCSCAERGRCGPGGTARLLGRDRILSIQRFSGGRDRILSTQRILKKNKWIYLKFNIIEIWYNWKFSALPVDLLKNS